MSDARPTHSRAWLIVGLLWFVACLNYLDRLMITTMRDAVKESIPMTEAQFGLLTSVFLWVYGVLSPMAGYLADRCGRSRVIILSLFVWSAVTWLTGHAANFEQLLIARALMGVSEACYIPAALALIADYHQGPTRSLATGLHMSGVYAGAALGGLGGYIAEHYHWQSAFYIFGATGVCYTIVLLAGLRDSPGSPRKADAPVTPSPARRESPIKAIGNLLRQGSFLVLLCHVGLLALAYWGINGWLPTYLREQFKLGLGQAGLSATGYVQAASFVGILVGGIWADSWSRRNVKARALVPFVGFCAAAPALFCAASSNTLSVALAGLVIFGLARGFSDANMMPVLCQIVDSRYRATGYGLLNCISCLVGGATIYLSGILRDTHFNLAIVFQIAAAGLGLAALLMLALKPRGDLETQ